MLNFLKGAGFIFTHKSSLPTLPLTHIRYFHNTRDISCIICIEYWGWWAEGTGTSP